LAGNFWDARCELTNMNSCTRQWLLACLMGLLTGATSAGAPSPIRPTVVELFTSQGCSSCPPADALLGELKSRPDVLALAFHVTYWDSLGWADRFALPYADQRQSRYVQALNLSSVFTPQLIVDGRHSFVGSDRAGILPAIGTAAPAVGITIQATGVELQIDVAAASSPASNAPRASNAPAVSGDVLLLALLPEAQTAIGRGENGGRTLREFNIVRASFALGRWDGGARRYTLRRAALPADAAVVAAVLQQANQRAVLGAATYALR
jgi:hypothetical protein